jgi:hypothetical protein
MTSASAMARLLWPRASKAATSRSRGVRTSTSLDRLVVAAD